MCCAATDSFKRAARLFGIGRYLLTLPSSVKDEQSLGRWFASQGTTPQKSAQTPKADTPNTWSDTVYRWAQARLDLNPEQVNNLIKTTLAGVNSEHESHRAIALILLEFTGTPDRAIAKAKDPAILTKNSAEVIKHIESLMK